MKRYIIIVFCVLSTLESSAQHSNIVLPDSIGKYLFELFINRADINQPQTKLLDPEATPNDWYSFHPETFWPCLLLQADMFNFNPQTTTYQTTYFDSYSCSNEAVQDCPFNLRIAMEKQNSDSIYVFSATVLWLNNAWSIQEIEPYICFYDKNAYNDIISFPPLNEDIPCPGEFPYPYNMNFHAITDLNNPVGIPSVLDFSEKVYRLIKDEMPYGNGDIFLTEEEYLEESSILNLIEGVLKDADTDEEEKRELQEIYNNPSILYEQQMVYQWSRLPENIKKEFNCDDIERPIVYETTFEIRNWFRKEKEGKAGQVKAIINANLEYNFIRAGIYYTATLRDGKWKLIHVQGFPYSIGIGEMVEAVPSDGIIEIEEAVEIIDMTE